MRRYKVEICISRIESNRVKSRGRRDGNKTSGSGERGGIITFTLLVGSLSTYLLLLTVPSLFGETLFSQFLGLVATPHHVFRQSSGDLFSVLWLYSLSLCLGFFCRLRGPPVCPKFQGVEEIAYGSMWVFGVEGARARSTGR
jgi:hypothetical protein